MTSREALCYPAERQGGSNCGPAGGCSCVTFTGVLLKTAQRNAGVQTLVLRLILSQTCLTPPPNDPDQNLNGVEYEGTQVLKDDTTSIMLLIYLQRCEICSWQVPS